MSSNSDIPKNDIFYNIIEELGEGWYISAQKLFSKVHFRDAEGGGGASYRLTFKWFLHKNFMRKM